MRPTPKHVATKGSFRLYSFNLPKYPAPYQTATRLLSFTGKRVTPSTLSDLTVISIFTFVVFILVHIYQINHVCLHVSAVECFSHVTGPAFRLRLHFSKQDDTMSGWDPCKIALVSPRAIIKVGPTPKSISLAVWLYFWRYQNRRFYLFFSFYIQI